MMQGLAAGTASTQNAVNFCLQFFTLVIFLDFYALQRFKYETELDGVNIIWIFIEIQARYAK